MTPKDPFLEGTFWDEFWRPIRSRALLFTPEFLNMKYIIRYPLPFYLIHDTNPYQKKKASLQAYPFPPSRTLHVKPITCDR